jgi:hypothetical protein
MASKRTAVSHSNRAKGIETGKNWDIINAYPRAKLACERTKAVINGRRPDRIPFSDNYWPGFVERYLRERSLPPDTSMAEYFDHDMVVLAPIMGPWPSDAGELEYDASGYEYNRDEYGLVTRSIRGQQTMPQHVDYKIKNKRDLDRMPFEDPINPKRSAQIERELPEICTRFCPVFKLGGPFSRSWRLRGMERFLEDIGADESFVKEMVSRMTNHLIAVGKSVVERLEWPRIQLHIADDFGSRQAPLFSPASYERIFLPNLKKMVDVFHAMGFKISYESEGNILPMLVLLDDSGIDGLAYMEPRSGIYIEDTGNALANGSFCSGISATPEFCHPVIGKLLLVKYIEFFQPAKMVFTWGFQPTRLERMYRVMHMITSFA